MPAAIVAEFPLGAYRGHVGEGELEMWPSPARLHAALLAAAGQGTNAVDSDGELSPSATALAALSWLESHPPDGMVLPLNRVNRSRNTVYRDIGALKPKMAGIKKLPKRDLESVAVGSSLMWVWESDPPRAVLAALADLCPDVPYLGQADSPVRLRLLETPRAAITHRRDPDARLSTARTTDMDVTVPRPGRATALVAAHREGMKASSPRPAADRATTDESERRAPILLEGLGRQRYVPVAMQDEESVPWVAAWLLPIRDDAHRPAGIRVADRVAWCVALHRALIALHGDGAPAVLTGRYAEGVPRPANRVAIQVLDRNRMTSVPFQERQAFVVALPAATDPGAAEAVERSVRTIRRLRGPRGISLHLDRQADAPNLTVNAAQFWDPPAEGVVRCWRTAVPAVAETRAPRGDGWSLADAIGLSVALAWRDVAMTAEIAQLGYDSRMRALAEAIREFSIEVLDVRPVTEQQGKYVHRVREGVLVQPYEAVLRLGDLAPDGRVFAAIGQSRHLGGGLLVPLDVPVGKREEWRTI